MTLCVGIISDVKAVGTCTCDFVLEASGRALGKVPLLHAQLQSRKTTKKPTTVFHHFPLLPGNEKSNWRKSAAVRTRRNGTARGKGLAILSHFRNASRHRDKWSFTYGKVKVRGSIVTWCQTRAGLRWNICIYIYTPDVADFKHGIITQNQFRILDNKNYIKINSHIRSLLS